MWIQAACGSNLSCSWHSLTRGYAHHPTPLLRLLHVLLLLLSRPWLSWCVACLLQLAQYSNQAVRLLVAQVHLQVHLAVQLLDAQPGHGGK